MNQFTPTSHFINVTFCHFCCFRCAVSIITLSHKLSFWFTFTYGLSVLVRLLLPTKPFFARHSTTLLAKSYVTSFRFGREVSANESLRFDFFLPNLLLRMRRNSQSCTSGETLTPNLKPHDPWTVSYANFGGAYFKIYACFEGENGFCNAKFSEFGG